MNLEIPSRLKWSCRRGMLELDVLLNNFLEQVYLHLPAHEQEMFVEFLKSSDQDLFEWLMGKKTPDNHNFRLMVEKIRENARNRR